MSLTRGVLNTHLEEGKRITRHIQQPHSTPPKYTQITKRHFPIIPLPRPSKKSLTYRRTCGCTTCLSKRSSRSSSRAASGSPPWTFTTPVRASLGLLAWEYVVCIMHHVVGVVSCPSSFFVGRGQQQHKPTHKRSHSHTIPYHTIPTPIPLNRRSRPTLVVRPPRGVVRPGPCLHALPHAQIPHQGG